MELYKFPIYVWWQITNKCNLKCPHCFADESREELNTKEIKRIIDQLSEAKTTMIRITGGEPFLREDIFDIFEYIKSKNIALTISTNGTLINKTMAQRIYQLKVEGIQISLDGHNKYIHEKIRGKDTFTKTIRGIRNLKNKNIIPNIMTTLFSYNIDYISEIADFVNSLGIKKFFTRRLVKVGRAKKNWDQLSPSSEQIIKAYLTLKEKQKLYPRMIIKPECSYMFGIDPQLLDKNFSPICECGKTQCGIKSNGIVTPCQYVTLSAGDLRKESFIEIWRNSEIFKKFRELDISKLKGKCSDCEFKKICEGGCRAIALERSGDFYASDPLCWWKEDSSYMIS